MQRVRSKGIEDSTETFASAAQENFFIGLVVEEHGQRGLCLPYRVSCRSRKGGALRDEGLGTPATPVPDDQFVSCGKQAANHGRPHLSQAQKCNLHDLLS
jgi:hypothetical protein